MARGTSLQLADWHAGDGAVIRSRRITLPTWLLALVLAAWPILFCVGGPLGRRLRFVHGVFVAGLALASLAAAALTVYTSVSYAPFIHSPILYSSDRWHSTLFPGFPGHELACLYVNYHGCTICGRGRSGHKLGCTARFDPAAPEGPPVPPPVEHHEPLLSTAGLHLTYYTRSDGVRSGFATIPLWLVVPALAAYPVAFLAIARPLRRRRRRKRGLCVNCGYNLKGLPEPRCPECGREFER